MMPEPIACLRCTFPRTLRVGEMRVCFQCRFSWRARMGTAPRVEPVLGVRATPGYSFSTAELARLKVYRLAVLAGFYSDSLQSRYRRSSQVSATRSCE